VDDVERVDDVAERLAHLPAVGVAHHGVKVDLGSRT
jgi:pterin-4a-carbinolamine dehydratase